MHILVATDKFKGSLTAAEVGDAVMAGLARAFPDATITSSPVADGGEGTTDTLHDALGGRWQHADVTDPLGRPIRARYSIAEFEKTPTAVIEMSAASGFERVLDSTKDPWSASSFGTGELMIHALRSGAKQILIGIGGSATNDGGSGMARALGFRFIDGAGDEVKDLPAKLLAAETITAPDDPLPKITVACDVTNPLLGPAGCTRIYGPQKGIGAGEFARHEERLNHLADLVAREIGVDYRDVPGAGAAGGLGFGLLGLCGATLEPGFVLVADAIGLREKIATADLVVTGEGFIDAQSLSGKAPGGVARLAREAGKPVIAVCGGADLHSLGITFDLVLPIRVERMSLEESLARAADLLESKVAESAPQLKALLARNNSGQMIDP